MGFNSSKWASQNRDKYEYKSRYGRKDFGQKSFPFVEPRYMPDPCTASLRLLPPVEGRCADGFRKVSTHVIPLVQGAPKTDAEGKPNLAAYPQLFCGSMEGAACFLCDLLGSCAEVVNTFPDHLQAIFKDFLNPKVVVLLPAVLDHYPDPNFVKPTDEQKRADKSLPWYAPIIPIPLKDGVKQPRIGVILKITTKKLEDIVGGILMGNPNVNSLFNGRELTFTRQANVYDIRVVDDGSAGVPLPEAEKKWMASDTYPNIDALYKNVLTLTYKEQYERVMRAWWRPDLEAQVGEIELGSDTPDDETVPWEPPY